MVINEQLINMVTQVNVNITTNIRHECARYISEESLFACIDALIKRKTFGGHLLFKDTLDEFTEEFTIGTNIWSGIIYYTEACVYLEVY